MLDNTKSSKSFYFNCKRKATDLSLKDFEGLLLMYSPF